jgi:putative transposase
MLKAVKYRIYPTEAQKVLLDKHIGSARFIYNLALETKQIAYAGNQVNLSCFDLIKQLPELKKECEWLKEINSQTLQQSVTNLDTAYTNFFKGTAKFPKYKSKKRGSQSFSVPQNVVLNLEEGKLEIPKFKKGIKAVFHRTFAGKVKQATISKTPTGKYFASVLIETNDVIKQKQKITRENTVGLDLGIKDFLTTSDGEVVSNPKFLKNSLSKLRYTQKKYSKNKGKRTRKKLARLHEKVANQRLDFLHKVSTKLIRDNQTIALETLNIKGMVKNHNLAQSIIDVSWGMFTQMLEYKADWYGVNIIRIGTFEPSSKTCSNCGHIHKELKLSDREWKCGGCGVNHDRDINAALNIKNFALRNYVSGTDTKTHSELPTLVGVLIYEASLPSGKR